MRPSVGRPSWLHERLLTRPLHSPWEPPARNDQRADPLRAVGMAGRRLAGRGVRAALGGRTPALRGGRVSGPWANG